MMKILVIDNIDSFVYNIVQYIGDLGAEPLVLRNDTDIDRIEEVNPDGIVLSPGPGTPKDVGVSTEVVREFGKEIPTLGVCLGHQIIAHAFGGRISQANQLMHGKTSKINHEDGILYQGIPNPFEAARYHSLIVKKSSLPDCFRITARTRDDEEVIMGIDHEKYPLTGVQFHPESVLTSDGTRIIKNFLEGIEP